MDFQTMNKQRKFVLIAAVAGVVGMFLPWWSVSMFGASNSINGMHGNGIIVFICFVVAGIMATMGDQKTTLPSTSWIITLICGALGVLIVGWDIMRSSQYGIGSALSFGIYLAALAAIGVVAAAFMFRAPTDTIKGGFDSFKKDIDSRMKNPNDGNHPPNPNPPM